MVYKPLLGSQAKPSFPKQPVKFICRIWSEITKIIDKKCLDAPSLRYSRKNKCEDVSSRPRQFVVITQAIFFLI